MICVSTAAAGRSGEWTHRSSGLVEFVGEPGERDPTGLVEPAVPPGLSPVPGSHRRHQAGAGPGEPVEQRPSIRARAGNEKDELTEPGFVGERSRELDVDDLDPDDTRRHGRIEVDHDSRAQLVVLGAPPDVRDRVADELDRPAVDLDRVRNERLNEDRGGLGGGHQAASSACTIRPEIHCCTGGVTALPASFTLSFLV